MYEDLKINNM